EGVPRAGIAMELEALSALLQRGLDPGGVLVGEVVLLGPVALDGRGEPVEIEIDFRMAAVINHTRANVVAVLAGREQAERPAHAEANDTHGLSGQTAKMRDRAAQVLLRLRDV